MPYSVYETKDDNNGDLLDVVFNIIELAIIFGPIIAFIVYLAINR